MRWRLILVLIPIVLSGMLSAQRYPFTTVMLKDGLPQSSIYGMVQDHQGYMWFATGGGVCRYDGVEFKTYTYYSGFEASHILDVAIDPEGKLWGATFGKGIGFFDGSSFRCFNSENGFKYTHIRDIQFSHEGDLWLSAIDYGLIRISIQGGIRIREFNEIPSSFKCREISQLADGDITIGGSMGYYRLDKGKNYQPQFHSMPGIIIKVVEDKSGGLWIAGRNIIYYQKGDSLIDHSDWLNTTTTVDVFDIFPDDPYVYISTGIGTLKIKGRKAEMLTTRNGLSNDYTFLTYKDHFGNIWTGTNDGANILNDKGMVHYDSDLEGGTLTSYTMLEDSWGNVLVGKSLKGYFSINDSGMVKLPVVFPQPFDPNQTHVRPTGELYVLGNFGIIYRFDHHRITWKWEIPDSITRANTFLPIRDTHQLLLGTSEGVFIVDEDDNSMKQVDGIEGTHFVHCFYDDRGNIWICQDGGDIHRITNGVAEDMTSAINPTKEIIKHALYDRFKRCIWLATERGVLAWNGKQTFHINTHNGLRSNLNYCITQDSSGRIWAGHLQGLDCIDPQQMKIHHYGYDQGFLPMETNGRAAYTDSKGNVWVGTTNITTKIKVDELGKDTAQGVLRLQRILANEVEKYAENYFDSGLPSIRLKHDENNLVFNVASVCFMNAKNTVYQWKLDGVDKHWNKKPNHREIAYYGLQPGSYKLHVKAENPDGFITNELTIPIYIAKPFWQTGIFYMSEVIIFMLIIYLSFRFTKKSSRNRFGQIMTLLTILITFESIMLYISGYTDKYTNGIPIFQLIMNVILAASLYPLEQRIKRFLEKRARRKK